MSGLIADPVVQNGFAVDVQFSFGNVDAKGQRRTDHYRMTTYLPVPMPEGMTPEDLPCKLEGPGIPPRKLESPRNPPS